MDVLKVEEQEDGSAIMTVSLTGIEQDLLLKYAITNIFRDEMERTKNEQRTVGNIGKLQSEETLKSEDL